MCTFTYISIFIDVYILCMYYTYPVVMSFSRKAVAA